jgi:hypothetical protein
MYDEKRHEIPAKKEVTRQACRREKVLRNDVEAQPGEIAHNPAPGTAGRVGDELAGNAQLSDSADSVERAGQSLVADINDPVKVDQNAFDHFAFSAGRHHT